jgi:hypothetical protein
VAVVRVEVTLEVVVVAVVVVVGVVVAVVVPVEVGLVFPQPRYPSYRTATASASSFFACQ